ncbi:transposase-like protein [Bradyrhizobium sp. GM24.11]
MSKDNIIKLIQPGTVADQLTEVLRNGARALLAKAVEAEVADFLGQHADLKTEDGHQRIVRHGHLPEREVMTGIGPVAVRQPRVRDREAEAADPERIRFSPSILPPYMRRSKSIETLLPILYLKGISTGDFSEALAALLGKDAAGLSASAIGRLKEGWLDDHTAWQKRDLSAKRYVYIWADGIHLEARLEDDKQCILVLIGATPEGRKELVGFTDGARESAHDWRDLLLDLKRRGLEVSPRLTVADGALGFWKAAGEVWPKTREQRCWVHKTANVLAKLPKSQQPKAKRALQEIWMAETKRRRRAGVRRLHRGLRAEIREGGRLPEQGSRHAARLLRLPGRALETPADDQPHRKHLRHRAPPHHPIEGMPVQQDGARHGLQTARGRTEKLATARRTQPVAKTRSRCDIQRRDRGHRQADRPSAHNRRRLTGPAVTKNWR